MSMCFCCQRLQTVAFVITLMCSFQFITKSTDAVETLHLSHSNFEQFHSSVVKRNVPPQTPFFDVGSCLSTINCGEIVNITSLSRTNKNRSAIYASTSFKVLKISISDDGKNSCACAILYVSSNPIHSIVMDNSNVYWLSEDLSEVYYIGIESISGSSTVLPLSQEMSALHKHHVKPACSIPSPKVELPDPTVVSETHFEFDLSQFDSSLHEWFTSSVCTHEPVPNITYSLSFQKTEIRKANDKLQNSCLGSSECAHTPIVDSSTIDGIAVDHLTPNTDYLVHVNTYSEMGDCMSVMISMGRIYRTECAAPGVVSNLRCLGVNNTSFKLWWDLPTKLHSDGVVYEVYMNGADNSLRLDNSKTRQELYFSGGPDVSNSFSIKTFPTNCVKYENEYSNSTIANCRSFQLPQRVRVDETSSMQVTANWDPPSDNSVKYVIIQWSNFNSQNTWSESELLNGSISHTYIITDLIPHSGYVFRTRQQYIGYSGEEGWLYSEQTTAKTAEGVPAFPEKVAVVMIPNPTLKWEAPNSNGRDLVTYVIEYRNRTSPNATRVKYGEWHIAANISATFNRWMLSSLREEEWYEFRVSAVNAIGTGDTSRASNPFYFFIDKPDPEDKSMWIIVGTTAGMVFLLFVIILTIACRHCGRKATTFVQSPPSSEITTIHLSYGTDLQLAQIRNMADLSNWKGIPNIPQDYMDLLPLFPRENLTLTDFLGKGAFGEVYRGIAQGIQDSGESERKVAVKTLREDSTDGEKCEFLMEAYFMSNFNHRNILSLLGVCLDNEPQFLILELMEGGDLLHYVREARPNPIMGPKLNIAGLVDICLDVAAGCKYLEEQRFIHRDLAARNCLVSTPAYITDYRVVKIGDFGLARDIYRNDYYHKAGEGLLPVRWMAPESLLDNLYTTQSDVWSFGVLLWEIMTFGEQPYPARTNMEVLQFIRVGGRLQKPENCPDDIYALMLKCWNSTCSLRPTFGWALEWLQEFKQRNIQLFSRGYRSSVAGINYTIVRTSEDDYDDENSGELATNLSPRHSTKSRVGHVNAAFKREESIAQTSGADSSDSNGVPISEVSSEEQNSSYLRVMNDGVFGNAENGNSLESRRDEAIQTSDPLSDEAPNYSLLGAAAIVQYPSPGNNILTIPKELLLDPPSERVFSSSEEDAILPYKGDLPITDEERLMRKLFWKHQSQLNCRSSSGRNSNSFRSDSSNRISLNFGRDATISVDVTGYNDANSNNSSNIQLEHIPLSHSVSQDQGHGTVDEHSDDRSQGSDDNDGPDESSNYARVGGFNPQQPASDQEGSDVDDDRESVIETRNSASPILNLELLPFSIDLSTIINTDAIDEKSEDNENSPMHISTYV